MTTKISLGRRQLVVADSATEATVLLASKAAGSKAPVLLCGESGTGKELVARLIHEKGPRKDQPFVSVNCAAVPEGLIEAEFFGYERGAFTGAIARRIGKFEQAGSGTLLLDEISEMPFALQAKLLRVLQEGEIDRLGGQGTIPVQCRIIATTNVEPVELIRQGKFREDLFYRLNVFRIDCAPLKGRTEGILRLAQDFLDRSSHEQGRSGMTFSEEAKQGLVKHGWPGNVRELQNVVERAVLTSERKAISLADLKFNHMADASGTIGEKLSDIEEKHIMSVLRESNGNRAHAAERLGITARTLRNKLKVYGVGRN